MIRFLSLVAVVLLPCCSPSAASVADTASPLRKCTSWAWRDRNTVNQGAWNSGSSPRFLGTPGTFSPGLRGGYKDSDVLRKYVLVSSRSEFNESSHDDLRDLALSSGRAEDYHRFCLLRYLHPLVCDPRSSFSPGVCTLSLRSCRFGVFLWDKMRNSTGAEAMYKAAIRADPSYIQSAADLGCLLHR